MSGDKGTEMEAAAADGGRCGVLAGGNWIIDHVKVIDSYPEQDALGNILEETWSNGGGPFNVLKDLGRLGAPFPRWGVGLVGDDADGALILEDCRASGIDTGGIQVVPGEATSYTDVMSVRSSGRRTFFHRRGANARLGPEHFPFVPRGAVSGGAAGGPAPPARVFYLAYLLLLDRLDEVEPDGSTGATAVLRAAGEAGTKTAVDIVSMEGGRFDQVVPPALPWTDLLFANEFEAERVTGVALTTGERGELTVDLDAVGRAAEKFFELGVRERVVIHFPEGALAMDRGGETVLQPSVAVPRDRIAGAAGAGDAFAAGVILGYHEGWELARGLELGVCAAAASLFETTCSGAVLPADDCLALGREFGYKEVPSEGVR